MHSLSQSLSSFSLSYLSFSLPTSLSLPLCVCACAANGLESLWANGLHDEKEEVRGACTKVNELVVRQNKLVVTRAKASWLLADVSCIGD